MAAHAIVIGQGKYDRRCDACWSTTDDCRTLSIDFKEVGWRCADCLEQALATIAPPTTTEELLDRPELSCYYGSTRGRLKLRDAHAQGILYFMVYVSHLYLPLGQSTHIGHFRTVEEAVKLAKITPHAEVHAIAAPFWYPEMCIYSSWWNPYRF